MGQPAFKPLDLRVEALKVLLVFFSLDLGAVIYINAETGLTME
jgi:hypothetical protein